MIEKTLVFVKPRNEGIAMIVFDYLDELLSSDKMRFSMSEINPVHPIPEALISEHYRDLKKLDEELFRANMEVYKTGTVFLASYLGTNIISRIRLKIGNLDPLKSESWTIRGRFSKDSAEEARREKRYHNNVIHASSSPDEAARELSLWNHYLGA